jgi:hypothetical protein
MKINDLLTDAVTSAGRRNQAAANMQNRGFTTNPANVAPPVTTRAPTSVTQTAPSTVVQQPGQSTSVTGDRTLDQPLAPRQRDPNAPGMATTVGRGIGQVAKGVGAVGGAVAGIGRALKKGYAAGANTVGGPGEQPVTGPSGRSIAPAGAGSGSAMQQADDISDLRARLQAVEKLIQQRA